MSTVKRAKRGPDRTVWQVRWRDPDGKQRARDFARRADADRWRTEVDHGKQVGSYVDPSRGKATVGGLATAWLEGRTGLTPATRDRYDGIIRTHIAPKWGTTRVAAVRHGDVQKWIAELDRILAAASVRKVHRVLSLILDAAVRDGRVAVNPAVHIDLPRVRDKEARYLTHGQVADLAERCGDPWRLMIMVLAYCGLRWGELAALRARRIDIDRQRVAIDESVTWADGGWQWGPPKYHQTRAVPVPAFLMGDLRDQVDGLDGKDLVFRGPRGALAQSQKMQNAGFSTHAVAMGLCDWVDAPTDDDPNLRKPVDILTPHDLRHTAASLAIQSGASIKAVQRMLGHKTATMTLDRYGHLYPDDLDTVAAALSTARAAALGG